MDENKKLVLAALVILLGTNSGSLYRLTNHDDTRADRHSETDLKQIRAECLSSDNAVQRELEREIRALENRLIVTEVKINEYMRKR